MIKKFEVHVKQVVIVVWHVAHGGVHKSQVAVEGLAIEINVGQVETHVLL